MLDQLHALIGKRVKVTTNLETIPSYTGHLVEIWGIEPGDPIERQFIAVRLQDEPNRITNHSRIESVTAINAI